MNAQECLIDDICWELRMKIIRVSLEKWIDRFEIGGNYVGMLSFIGCGVGTTKVPNVVRFHFYIRTRAGTKNIDIVRYSASMYEYFRRER